MRKARILQQTLSYYPLILHIDLIQPLTLSTSEGSYVASMTQLWLKSISIWKLEPNVNQFSSHPTTLDSDPYICVFPIEAGGKKQQEEKTKKKTKQNKTKQNKKNLQTGCNNNPVFNKGYNSGHFFRRKRNCEIFSFPEQKKSCCCCF